MAKTSSDNLGARLKSLDRATRWQFAVRGAIGALMAALVLEFFFAMFGVGRYFYDNGADVVIFHHSVERAKRGHLGTGDVQVTLYWKGHDDVDLHVIDPYGQHVYYGNKQVAGGGRLDLDMNAGHAPWETQGQENIYWPYNSAPQGVYRVQVHHYRRNGGPDSIPFKLRILNRGRITWQRGTALYVMPSNGVAGDRNGNTLDSVNALEMSSVADAASFSISTPPRTVLFLRPVQWVAILVCALWVAAIATTLAFVLQSGLNDWYRGQYGNNPHVDRPFFVNEEKGQEITRRGLAWNAGHGALSQIAFGLASFFLPGGQELWRMAAWVVLAAWSGGRMGRLFPRHLPPAKGRSGGWRGGLAGGILFWILAFGGNDSLFYGADAPARLLAAVVIGGCIGWMIELPHYLPPATATPEPESNKIVAQVATAPVFLGGAPPQPSPPVTTPTKTSPVTADVGEPPSVVDTVASVPDAPPASIPVDAALPQDASPPPRSPVPEINTFIWSRRGGVRRWQARPGGIGRSGVRGRRWRPGD